MNLPVPVPATFQFRLSTLFWVMTLVAVNLTVFIHVPSIGVLLFLCSVPGFMWAAQRTAAAAHHGQRVTRREQIVWFCWDSLGMLVGLAAVVAMIALVPLMLLAFFALFSSAWGLAIGWIALGILADRLLLAGHRVITRQQHQSPADH